MCVCVSGVADFFSASCAPGANEPGDPASLCQLCKGDGSGQHICEMSSNEKYFGHEGAFRFILITLHTEETQLGLSASFVHFSHQSLNYSFVITSPF